MTNDQDSSSDEPFQVVLIDLQKAGVGCRIKCVKKPLTKDLKYVAISYRWGELQETTIDTGVGYLASITSFALKDFYKLCDNMAHESELHSMDYVWVDAICVNQSDHDERKATIYHMTEIYEHATWILAVPDLHAAHLRMMHETVMDSIVQHHAYLYHLLHGHTDELQRMDLGFLYESQVPMEYDLLELLRKYTDSFADNFMTPNSMSPYYHSTRTIQHLYKNSNNKTAGFLQRILGKGLRTRPDIQPPHQCDEVECPLEYFDNPSKVPTSPRQTFGWDRPIIERRTDIIQAMAFLTDLIVDWSSRVWVISEFHISKQKNNLKFWFNQLELIDDHSFFPFDIHDPRLARIQNTKLPDKRLYPNLINPVYFTFYQRLINQLNRQTFLEMMLKSKASKNEDRFYAIFPFVPQYKHLLQKEELDNMNTLLSVKLKLYKVMTNEEKVLLLYLSSIGARTLALPTFATSAIDWAETDLHAHTDFTGHSTDITLLYQDTVDYYLRLKTSNPFTISEGYCYHDDITETLNRLLHPKTLRQDRDGTWVDTAELSLSRSITIFLNGNFKENIWILSGIAMGTWTNTIVDPHDDFPGFHIY